MRGLSIGARERARLGTIAGRCVNQITFATRHENYAGGEPFLLWLPPDMQLPRMIPRSQRDRSIGAISPPNPVVKSLPCWNLVYDRAEASAGCSPTGAPSSCALGTSLAPRSDDALEQRRKDREDV